MDERLLSGCKFVDVGGEKISLGKIQKTGGEIAIKSIEKGVQMAMKNEISALATAPINKEALRLARLGVTSIIQPCWLV